MIQIIPKLDQDYYFELTDLNLLINLNKYEIEIAYESNFRLVGPLVVRLIFR